jgi:hypothetical protein
VYALAREMVTNQLDETMLRLPHHVMHIGQELCGTIHPRVAKAA